MKVLSIGNSFSQDAHKWLYDVCKSGDEEIYNVNLYIGGCSLETHRKNFCGDEPAYDYEIKGEAVKKISLKEAILSENWDVITFQQASYCSGMYDILSRF